DPASDDDQPVQRLLLPAAVRRAGRVRDLAAQLPHRRRLPADGDLRRRPGGRLDHDGGAAGDLQRVHDRAAVDAGGVRGAYPERRQSQRHLPRGGPGAAVIRPLVVIGGQRCGTTYLYTVLVADPQIVTARATRPDATVFLPDEA